MREKQHLLKIVLFKLKWIKQRTRNDEITQSDAFISDFESTLLRLAEVQSMAFSMSQKPEVTKTANALVKRRPAAQRLDVLVSRANALNQLLGG